MSGEHSLGAELLGEPPVPYQHLGELAAMIDKLRDDPPASILEIGVWGGGTNLAFGEAFPDAERVGVDIEIQPSARLVGATLVEGSSQDNMIRERVQQIRDQFDFVFIDGAHDEDSTMADLEWAVSLSPRWIGLHDITCKEHPALDTWKVWAAIVKYAPDLGREVFEFKQQDDWWGIGLILLPKAAE